MVYIMCANFKFNLNCNLIVFIICMIVMFLQIYNYNLILHFFKNHPMFYFHNYYNRVETVNINCAMSTHLISDVMATLPDVFCLCFHS